MYISPFSNYQYIDQYFDFGAVCSSVHPVNHIFLLSHYIYKPNSIHDIRIQARDVQGKTRTEGADFLVGKILGFS